MIFPKHAKICQASTAIIIKYLSHFHSSSVNSATPRVSTECKREITMLDVLVIFGININKAYILLVL